MSFKTYALFFIHFKNSWLYDFLNEPYQTFFIFHLYTIDQNHKTTRININFKYNKIHLS